MYLVPKYAANNISRRVSTQYLLHRLPNKRQILAGLPFRFHALEECGNVNPGPQGPIMPSNDSKHAAAERISDTCFSSNRFFQRCI